MTNGILKFDLYLFVKYRYITCLYSLQFHMNFYYQIITVMRNRSNIYQTSGYETVRVKLPIISLMKYTYVYNIDYT